jgi:hypothetical protein
MTRGVQPPGMETRAQLVNLKGPGRSSGHLPSLSGRARPEVERRDSLLDSK